MMTTEFGRWTVALGLSVGLSIWPRAGVADDLLCRGLAARMRALPPPAATSALWNGPIERLAVGPHPYVRVDTSENLFRTGDSIQDAQKLRARIQQQYRPSPPVLAAIDAMALSSGGEAWLRRLGSSSVRAVELMQGSMDCSYFQFFDARPGHEAVLVPSPPQIIPDTGDFCVTDRGLLGEVGGVPAFIEQSWPSTDPDYDIVLSVWKSGHWAPPCEVKISYRPIYRVGESHCRGDLCRALPAAARDMADSRERQLRLSGGKDAATFRWGASSSPAGQAKIAKIQALIGPPADNPLPTLGDKADPNGFGDDTVVIPLQLDGQTYAAVLGHRSMGWRVFPQYLLAVYDLKDGRLDPVAGLVIEQS